MIEWTCPNCSRVFRGNLVLPVRCSCGRSATPTWVAAIKRLRKDADTGIGDTVQRIAARFGGELFKRFAARVGMPCGCTERQEEWNQRWPY